MADTDKQIYRASTTAPVNIAVIKYWGKRDATLNLPTNSSLSVTLSQRDLRTHTTATCSAAYPAGDALILNSNAEDITAPRTQAVLRSLRALRASLEATDASLPKLSTYPLRISSVNNFPTAAGLASSAAGLAALVRAIADLYALPTSPSELSLIARQGSGSACRSLFGGYVAWDQGTLPTGLDSRARLVAPASHWPEMRALILVVSAAKKGVSSTTGMQTTVATSTLFQTRAATVVPARMKAMENAILARDFAAFATLTMADSNSFHATCLDTAPPIFYLNDVSRAAIRAVEEINDNVATTTTAADGKKAPTPMAAYTFDAGPNAVIYYLAEHEHVVAGTFKKTSLGQLEGWGGEQGRAVDAAAGVDLDARVRSVLEDGVSRVILTRVDEGPESVQDHLI
ncbi:MAG: hypothetical protein M1819_006557 [Sarea resinae]|nr:MAG: hypothetical protein M1819_006557 [Sarea resinae]